MPDYIDGFTSPNNTTYELVSKTGRGLVRATMDSSTSTATAFVVSATGITELYDGLTIVVKNTKVASDTNCTLKLNNTDAKRIWLSQANSYCTTHWGLNQTFIFVYDATNERWELQQGRDTDSNTFYTLRPYYTNPVVGGNGVFKASLFVRLKDGTFSSLTTSSGTGTKTFDTSLVFDISKVYYFSGSSDQAVGGNLPNDTFTESNISIDLRYSLNDVTTSASTSSIVGKEALYMACRTTNDGYFKFSHYAQESSIRTPNSLDGRDLVYVYLGYTQDSYRLNLDVNQVPYKINPDFARNPSSTNIPIFLPYSEGEYARNYGINSHAEGDYTLASGTCSHAEGCGSPHDSTIHITMDFPNLPNKASGSYSHTEGHMTEANGIASHAEGGGDYNDETYVSTQTIADGNYSHAEGYGTHTTGVASHSEGSGTTASGDYSHAEGSNTTASGDNSHAEGIGTTASGDNAHTEGTLSTASGTNAHAEGWGTLAYGNEQHVSGRFNISNIAGTYAEIIGNGSGMASRSNARTLDWNGNEELLGNLKFMDCADSTDISTYETNPVEPSIKWKEKGYGDKFEIRPYFHGSGDENFLGVLASTGGADTDPDVHRVLEIRPSGGEVLHGNVPTRNYHSTLIDMSKSNNGVSSAQYIGSYYQDIDNRAFAKFTPVILSGGESILEIYSQNFNTSGASVGSNTLQLTTRKDGSRAVYTNCPEEWRSAIMLLQNNNTAMNMKSKSVDTTVSILTIPASSSSSNLKLVITLPSTNWGKFYIEVYATANFGFIHSELFVGTNGSASIDQCGYKNEVPSWTTVSGCSAVPNNSALTWTADKANRKLTSSAFGKYGIITVKVISSTNNMSNAVTISTVDA